MKTFIFFVIIALKSFSQPSYNSSLTFKLYDEQGKIVDHNRFCKEFSMHKYDNDFNNIWNCEYIQAIPYGYNCYEVSLGGTGLGGYNYFCIVRDFEVMKLFISTFNNSHIKLDSLAFKNGIYEIIRKGDSTYLTKPISYYNSELYRFNQNERMNLFAKRELTKLQKFFDIDTNDFTEKKELIQSERKAHIGIFNVEHEILYDTFTYKVTFMDDTQLYLLPKKYQNQILTQYHKLLDNENLKINCFWYIRDDKLFLKTIIINITNHKYHNNEWVTAPYKEIRIKLNNSSENNAAVFASWVNSKFGFSKGKIVFWGYAVSQEEEIECEIKNGHVVSCQSYSNIKSFVSNISRNDDSFLNHFYKNIPCLEWEKNYYPNGKFYDRQIYIRYSADSTGKIDSVFFRTPWPFSRSNEFESESDSSKIKNFNNYTMELKNMIKNSLMSLPKLDILYLKGKHYRVEWDISLDMTRKNYYKYCK